MYTEKKERDTKGERRHILKKRMEQRGETINENTHEKKTGFVSFVDKRKSVGFSDHLVVNVVESRSRAM